MCGHVTPHSQTDDSPSAPSDLGELWKITNDPDDTFEGKLHRVFDLETEALDLPYGFLSRIDRATNTQTIETAYGSHTHLQDGETVPLSESYCRHTIQQSDGFFDINDAAAEGFADDPAYDRFGLGSYLGARIDLDEGLYGTICFASSDPREESITDQERELLDLIAMWTRTELQNRTSKERLHQQSERVEELARVISHDLRNPLNVAQGQLTLLEDSIQEAVEQIDAAHHRMGKIIEQMLQLASLNDPISDPPPVELRACVTEAWQLVPAESASLDLHFESACIAADRDRLASLFENLFANAITHARETVTVEVGVTETGFYVADDGPGIPTSERESVFTPGYSTNNNGTGFGLSIVKRIAEAHDWDVSLTESDAGGTRFEFTNVDFVPADSS